MPLHPTSHVCGGSWHNGLLSVMQRGLFNVKYSYGCWVIGPCMYIKRRSVLTSHRSSGLDVPGWNRVRNTHCAAMEKKPFLCFQTQPQLHPDVQIIHRLFSNCLFWHANAALLKWFWWDVSMWDNSEWQHVGKKENSLRSVGVYRTEGRRSRQGCLKMRWVLTACRPTVIAAQAALWFSDQCFPEEKENSKGQTKMALWSRVERQLRAMACMINSYIMYSCISNCGQQCRLESAPVKLRACDRRATIDTDLYMCTVAYRNLHIHIDP